MDGTPSKVGSMGDFGCFSFFPTKNLGGIGDGGIITVGDTGLAKKLRIKRVHGGEKKYYHSVIGGNFRLDPVQAVVIRVKLPHLHGWHRSRRENAHVYNQLFEESTLSPMVQTPKEQHPSSLLFPHIYNQYVIRAGRRDELMEFLKQRGVSSEIYYPVPFHEQNCFAGVSNSARELENSSRAAKEVLSLPVYPELSREMQEYVVDQITEFYREN